MSDPAHCRIRRVRMKGGADLTVLRRPEVNNLGSEMMRHARNIATGTPDVAGYFVIAWDVAGGYSMMYEIGDASPIPMSLFPSWLEEIARREIVTARQIAVTLNGREYVEPPRPLE